MNILSLVLLCAVLFSTVNASETTQTFADGASVTILTGEDASSLYYINNNPLATSYQIYDDSTGPLISLPFNFTFFSQTFDHAWMYSNGVLGFQTPSWQSFCCNGGDLNTTTGEAFNYKIMPLWTDLISYERNFYSLSTNSSIIFGWYNINEYGSNNYNSFEIELRSDNTFSIIYGDINVQYHNITMGITGDLQQGEFYQFYTGIGSNQQADYTTLVFQTNAPDPCDTDPLFSTSCEGYPEAFFNYQCSANPLYDSTCQGYGEAYALQNVLGSTEETTSQSTTPDPTTNTVAEPSPAAGVVGDSTSTFTDVRTDVGGVSMSSTGSIVIENGVPDVARDSAGTGPEKKTIDTLAIAKSAIAETEKIALTTANESIQQSMSEAATSNGIDEGLQQYIATSSDNMLALISTTVTYGGIAGKNASGLPVTAYEEAYSDQDEKQSALYIPDVIEQDDIREKENKNKQDIINELLNASGQAQQEDKKDQDMRETVNKNTQDNDAAEGGVDINMLAQTNVAFDSYLQSKLIDANFYQEKEIYKDQKPTDNQRALRQLNIKNDYIHQQMVDDQYNK